MVSYITGIKVEEFERTVKKVRPEWKNKRNVMEECPICRSWKTKYCVLSDVYNAQIFRLSVQFAQREYLSIAEENGAIAGQKN